MIGKLAGLWPVRRVAALAVGFWETFLRDNKVVPPALAVAALFVFAWIVVGSFIGAPEDEPISSQNEVAQSEGAGAAPPAPEIENPNTDSYAAYQSKDPFRQLFQTAESTTQQEDTGGDADSEDPADDPTSPDDPASDDPGDPADDGFQDPGDGASTGAPGGGAADDQYENGQTPREDPTDTGDTGPQAPQTPAPQTPAPQTPAPQAPAPQTPAPQAPAPQAPPADSGGNLFDSGGDLEDPYGR